MLLHSCTGAFDKKVLMLGHGMDLVRHGGSSWGQVQVGGSLYAIITLPETNSEFAPKNGWLEYDPFLLGWPIFRGELLVLGSVFSMIGEIQPFLFQSFCFFLFSSVIWGLN